MFAFWKARLCVAVTTIGVNLRTIAIAMAAIVGIVVALALSPIAFLSDAVFSLVLPRASRIVEQVGEGEASEPRRGRAKKVSPLS